MKKSSKRMASVWCGIALSLSAVGVAQGQNQPQTPPLPEYPVVDENGVDVQTQSVMYTHASISIGPADHHGLQWTHNSLSDSFYGYWNYAVNDLDGTETDSVQFENFSAWFVNGVSDRGDGSAASGPGGRLVHKDGTAISFGHQLIYDPSGSGTLTAVGPDSQTTYGYWMPDSVVYPDGVITTIHYRDELIYNKVLGDSYAFPRIQSVTSNTGYQLKYFYASDDSTQDAFSQLIKIVAINNAYEYCNPDADSCAVSSSWPSAQFAGSNSPSGSDTIFETDITDAGGGQVRSQSDAQATFVKIQTPESGAFNRQYTLSPVTDPINSGQYVVPLTKVTQAIVDGRVTNYAFSYSGTTATVTSTSPLGDTRTYVYPELPGSPLPNLNLFSARITSFTNGLNETTRYAYDVFNRLSQVTNPEGNSTVYEYDNGRIDAAYVYGYPRGNITRITVNPKPGSGQGPMSESWTYPDCVGPGLLCGKPTTFTDFNNHTTSYTYDANHGGLLTETLPPDSRGIQPVKRYVYQQRSAQYLNSSGTYVAGSPIWMLTEEHTCMNSSTSNNVCAGGANDEVVTTYDYGPNAGPNNLLLRGKVVTYAGQSRRTCYGHDQFGNTISETEPQAGLTSCP